MRLSEHLTRTLTEKLNDQRLVVWYDGERAFAEFARSSTQYAAIYSSFAIFLLFLIWLYLNWLILLLGASIAFYIQNPEYLVLEQGEPRLSNRMRERVALMLMYLIGSTYRDGGTAWTFSDLTQRLGVPTYALQMVLEALDVGIEDRRVPGNAQLAAQVEQRVLDARECGMRLAVG